MLSSEYAKYAGTDCCPLSSPRVNCATARSFGLFNVGMYQLPFHQFAACARMLGLLLLGGALQAYGSASRRVDRHCITVPCVAASQAVPTSNSSSSTSTWPAADRPASGFPASLSGNGVATSYTRASAATNLNAAVLSLWRWTTSLGSLESLRPAVGQSNLCSVSS